MKKSSSKPKPPYPNQKVALYFDEQFPREVVEGLKSDTGWKSKFRFYSVYDFGNENKDDSFQFGFCKGRGFTLVTLDDDFLNDKTYPFNGFPGIVRIVVSGNDLDTIYDCIDIFLEFLVHVPYPKDFLIDTKLKVSREGCVMKRRDALTGEVKAYNLVPGETTVDDIIQEFHYLY